MLELSLQTSFTTFFQRYSVWYLLSWNLIGWKYRQFVLVEIQDNSSIIDSAYNNLSGWKEKPGSHMSEESPISSNSLFGKFLDKFVLNRFCWRKILCLSGWLRSVVEIETISVLLIDRLFDIDCYGSLAMTYLCQWWIQIRSKFPNLNENGQKSHFLRGFSDSEPGQHFVWTRHCMNWISFFVLTSARFLRCRFCNAIWRKKVAFENFSTVYMDKRILRSKIWRVRTFETSWDFAN